MNIFTKYQTYRIVVKLNSNFRMSVCSGNLSKCYWSVKIPFDKRNSGSLIFFLCQTVFGVIRGDRNTYNAPKQPGVGGRAVVGNLYFIF